MEKIYNMVLQSSTKGIRAVEIADKIDIHKTTVYRDLNSLYLMGKVESDHGTWRAKTGEQTIKPLEKEIVIELPIPKNEWQREALLEAQIRRFEKTGFPNLAEDMRITLEKLRGTRIIRVRGKNVDDLDLEKLAKLVEQAKAKRPRTKWERLIG